MGKPRIGSRDGVGLTEGHSSSNQASDKELFEAVRTELDAIKAGLEVTEPDATDLPTALTLLNDIKTKLNAVAALVAEFEK